MSTTTTRRAVLAAAMPALAVPALAEAAEPDPIFAAIEAHRRAVAAFHAAVRREFAIEEIAQAEHGGDINEADRDPRGIAAREETGEASHLADSIAVQILDVRPTTIAGAVALLRYVFEFSKSQTWPDHRIEIDDYCHADGTWNAALHKSLADALAAIAARGVS